jgi:hypothetical protein
MQIPTHPILFEVTLNGETSYPGGSKEGKGQDQNLQKDAMIA